MSTQPAELARLAVRVETDSNPARTTVYIDGKAVENIVRVAWQIGPDDLATCTIELEDVELHVVSPQQGMAADAVPIVTSRDACKAVAALVNGAASPHRFNGPGGAQR